MQILITHTSWKASTALHVTRLQILGGLALLLVSVTLVTAVLYHLVFLKAAREGWPIVNGLVQTVGRDELAQRDRYLRENLDVMARRIGEMQARLIQLESMGERVSGLAGIKPQELKQLLKPPSVAAGGRGGPYVPLTGAPGVSSLAQLSQIMAVLEDRAAQHGDVLMLSESRLLEKRLADLMVPNSRPVEGGVGSGFGFRADPFTGRAALHTGLDFPADNGAAIRASAGGVVLQVVNHPQYGLMVELDHGRGLVTRYAHTSMVAGQGRRPGQAGRPDRRGGHHRPVDRPASAFRGAGRRRAAGSGPVPGRWRSPISRRRWRPPRARCAERLCRQGAAGARCRPCTAVQRRPLKSSVCRDGAHCSPTLRRQTGCLVHPPCPRIPALHRELPAQPGLTAAYPRFRMLPKLLTSIFGSRNERLLKQYRRTVEQINALEPSSRRSTTRRCRRRPLEFRQRHAEGESLDDLLPEAFAVVREGSKRALKMRHFDVQLLGGMTLHNGKIAEMRTGEGKTLMSTLPVYLNAIAGTGVHLVTVNDYLAQRDAEWMGRLYTFLGLTVGVNLPNMMREEKQAAYAADVTYGTNNEFGFDYLRDNMVQDVADRVQRQLALCDRRRGRLDPDRRGPHAADHQRPGRRPHRDVRAHQRRRAGTEEADRRGRHAHRRRRDRAGRLHRRREDAPGVS